MSLCNVRPNAQRHSVLFLIDWAKKKTNFWGDQPPSWHTTQNTLNLDVQKVLAQVAAPTTCPSAAVSVRLSSGQAAYVTTCPARDKSGLSYNKNLSAFSFTRWTSFHFIFLLFPPENFEAFALKLTKAKSQFSFVFAGNSMDNSNSHSSSSVVGFLTQASSNTCFSFRKQGWDTFNKMQFS